MKPAGSGPRTANRFANKQKGGRKLGSGPPRSKPSGQRSYSSDTASSSDTGSDRDDHGSESDVEDAEDYCKGGYHPVQIGEKFKGGRYVVLRKLGWGHFSTVWLVLDTHTNGFAALKVQKSAPHYTEAARDEVTLLDQLKSGDPSDAAHCVRLLDHFEHAGPHGLHVCLVFEVLGDNLLALIKAYDYRGLPLAAVRNLVRQTLVAVDYMHSRCAILHTDIKPENVMLVDTLAPRRWELELPAPGAAAAARGGGGGGSGGGGGGAGSSGGGASGGSGAGGGALTKNQKKKAKRKQAKAAANGSASQSEPLMSVDSEGLGGTEGGEEGGDEAAGPHQQQQEQQQQQQEQQQEQQPGQANGAAAGEGQQQQQEQQQEQRRPLVYESCVLRTSDELASARAKVVDFGNACWLHKRFTDDVQTRQYRCPEVILGAKWGAPADVWSVACVAFELATGDYLFDPKGGPTWDRDEDHLALMIELLGRMPRRVWSTGRQARDYFNRQGELRHIRRLKPWGLREVLEEKYRFPPREAAAFADFLLPMLRFVPEERATAAEMLRNPWLADAAGGGEDAGGGTGSIPVGAAAGGGGSGRSRSRSPERRTGGGASGGGGAARRSSSGGGVLSDEACDRDSRSPRRRAPSEPASKRSRSPSPRGAS